MSAPDTLYDEDIILWSERQADLLRRLAAGEPMNETPDWTNIVEEIEGVGRSERRAVRSLLLRAFIHMLKIKAWPDSLSVPHWRSEVRVFLADARYDLKPSMRQWIDIADIWRDALHALPGTMDGLPPLSVPDTCPVTLDELLSEEP